MLSLRASGTQPEGRAAGHAALQLPVRRQGQPVRRCSGQAQRAVIDASDQSVAASYAYDEFGVLTGQTLAQGFTDQPYRFSTKRYYEGSGLNYYGYRFYSAGLGRWLSRDPIGEAGGLNLYGFVGNGPMNWLDAWGREADMILVTPNDPALLDPRHPEKGTYAELNEELIKFAKSVPTNDDMIVVVVHGNRKTIQNPIGTDISPLKLVTLIKGHNKYHAGITVKLYACSTGRGVDSYAARTESEFGDGTLVEAPTDDLDFSFWEYERDATIDDGGVWILVPIPIFGNYIHYW